MSYINELILHFPITQKMFDRTQCAANYTFYCTAFQPKFYNDSQTQIILDFYINTI